MVVQSITYYTRLKILFVLALLCYQGLMDNFSYAVEFNKDEEFDHALTGYLLLGQHQFVDCENCHIKGAFRGTPKTCDRCHNGVLARGQPANHIPTNAQCDTCHSMQMALGIDVRMDHSTITTRCFSCHNGSNIIGKKTGHISASNNCESCHITVSFVPTKKVDHNEINLDIGCASCHNGTIAIGKPPTHPPANNYCNECHSTRGF